MAEPYYHDERSGITIYHADCREVLPLLVDDCADMVLTDPPYSEAIHAGARGARPGVKLTTAKLIDFDSIMANDLQAVFGLLGRLAKAWVVSFIDWRHMKIMEDNPPLLLRFVRFGIWDKPNGAPQFTGDRPATGWEAIALLHRTGKRMSWQGAGSRAVWRCNKESGPHPTMKPLPLICKLMALFSQPGDLILDPFMGSGTTLRAAKDMGRRAIGIEIKERYCEIAANRLAQQCLFPVEIQPDA